MIPRYDGLVPAIRGPASSAAHVGSTSNTVATTVKRYVICPTPTLTFATVSANNSKEAGGEHERRLYVFSPSADVSAPPRELRVASYFFGDTDPQPSAGASLLAAEEESSGDSAGDADEADDAEGRDPLGHIASLNSSRSAVNAGAPSGKARRRRRRGREPMRLEYEGIMDAKATAALSDRVVRVASTPASAYSHLTCVLVDLPSSWQDVHDEGAESSTKERAPPRASTYSRLVRPTALIRPILQMWGERKEASAAVDSVGGGTHAAIGISNSWYSEQSTRINNKDWKTMDAMDAEAHKPTNWSDDDGGADDGGDGSAERALAARDRKRAKAEATSQAVRSFLAGTKDALRQQAGVEDAEALRLTGNETKPPTLSPAATAANAASHATEKESERDERINGPFSTDKSHTRGGMTTLDAAAPRSMPTTAQSAPAPHAAAPTVSSTTTNCVHDASDASMTLPALAAAVLQEMRQADARTTAPFTELQRRILKRLPDFSVVNQKVKSPETKKEAVEWFQTRQRELRVWLQGQGHMISSDGTVTFVG
ncbi:hypothetical protein ABL78_4719 [Leptomonas seymouri]|uniref:Uncharacterized protein n=1 Tax=Leptomonas seymouri TaxID=5684 RepID=A0A0N0P596_LEPSE|nr:hypothetical protein ABL78_4719 [Leptomonas seymouri]|eukprot:KPI86206.1 hypothetical protein ABL78_4719 [Leptomonas seymouri]